MKKYFIITALLLLTSNLSAGLMSALGAKAPGKRGPDPVIQLKQSTDELKNMLKSKMPELTSMLKKMAPNIDKELDKLKTVAENLITKGENLLLKIKTEKVPEKIIDLLKNLAKELITLNSAINTGDKAKIQQIISEITNKIPVPLFFVQMILMKVKQIIMVNLPKLRIVLAIIKKKLPAAQYPLIQKIDANFEVLVSKLLNTLVILVNYASMVQLGNMFKRKLQQAQPAIMQKLKQAAPALQQRIQQVAPALQQKLKELAPALQKKFPQGQPAWLKKLQQVAPPAVQKETPKEPAKPIVLPTPITQKI